MRRTQRLAVLASLALAGGAAAAGPRIPTKAPASNHPIPADAPPTMTDSAPRLAPGLAPFGRQARGAGIWTAQGPKPIEFGQVEGMEAFNNPVSGAVHVVIAHPTDAGRAWLGCTNGGVWRTDNLDEPEPTWRPLTDQLGSLSIGAMDLDPTDAKNSTLVAGIGRYSSISRIGGARLGILRSTDAGESWTVSNGGTLNGANISGVAARGQTIVVSVSTADSNTYSNIGIFRSTDGGTTFAQVSNGSGAATGLPGGACYDLVGDPTNPEILYTGVVFAPGVGGANGIYKSTDTGATWAKVSTPTVDAEISDSTTSNIELSVGLANNVYVGVINSGVPTGLFRSGDGGASWVTLEDPSTNEGGQDVGLNPQNEGPGFSNEENPGSQGTIHFSILADPVDASLVYAGGDRQPTGGDGGFPNSIGANNYSGRLFRLDATQPIGSQDIALTHVPTTTLNSSPHADSRDMDIDATGEIIEGDDGGIYRRTNPRGTGDWEPVVGTLQNTEFHSVAWDSVSDIIIGGAQDAGTSEQYTPGGARWIQVSQGDGGVVAVDDRSEAAGGFSWRYSSFQFMQDFRRVRYDAANNFLTFENPALAVTNSPGNSLFSYDSSIQFYTVHVLNAVDATLGAIGTRRVYTGTAKYDSITDATGDTGARISAIVYGGFIGAAANADFLVYSRASTSGSGAQVNRRTAPGAFTSLPYAGVTPRDLIVDPTDYRRMWVLDPDSVWRWNEDTNSFTDITGDLRTSSGWTSTTGFRTLQFVNGPAGVDALIVGGPGGVFVSYTDNPTDWAVLGPDLPNGIAYDLQYSAQDDVLLAGTLGRGAFTVPNVTNALFSEAEGDAWSVR